MNDIAKYQFLLSLFNSALSIIAMVVVWWRTREKAVSSKFADFYKRMGEMDKRLTKLETTLPEALEKRLIQIEEAVKHPTVCTSHGRMEKNDEKLFQSLDALHGDVRELAGSLKGLSRAVDLMNEYLINRSDK